MSSKPADPVHGCAGDRPMPAPATDRVKPTFEQFAGDDANQAGLYHFAQGLLQALDVPEHRLRPQEAVADTFSYMWQKWDEIQVPTAYMYFPARRFISRAARENRRFAAGLIHRDRDGDDDEEQALELGTPLIGMPPMDPQEELAWQESARRVQEVMERAGLTADERLVFEQCAMYGVPRADVAAALEKNVNSLSSPMSRSRRKLQRLLGTSRPPAGLVWGAVVGASAAALLGGLAYLLRNTGVGAWLEQVPANTDVLLQLALAMLAAIGHVQLRDLVLQHLRRWTERRYGTGWPPKSDRTGMFHLVRHTADLPQFLRLVLRVERARRRRRRDDHDR